MSAQHQLDLAVSHLSNGRPELARQVVQPLLQDRQFGPDAHHVSALASKREGQVGVAVQALEQLVTAYPGFAQAWFNLGVCYGESGRRLQSISCYQSCLRNAPDHVDAMWNLADALRLDEQFETALLLLNKLEMLEPYAGLGDLYHRRAVCQACLGRVQAAIDDFQTARQLGTSDPPMTLWESSHALLLAGHYEQGWAAYENRFAAAAGSGVRKHNFDIPEWRGQSLGGKRLCIHAEQGLGDQIMFASIVPQIIEEASDVLLAIHPALVDLFRASFPVATVIAHTPEQPAALPAIEQIDYQIPIGSLAAYRRCQRSDFDAPASHRYLRTTDRRHDAFARVLDGLVPERQQRRCIGVMWGANPCHGMPDAARRSRQKSLPVQQLAAFASVDPSVVFVSLQNYEVAPETGGCGALDLIDCHRYLKDMADTAALISHLDLVISVDTSVAHLAGAMGKPLWVMLMEHADWRWGQHATRCQWYPHARLYRQRRQGNWSDVLDIIARNLSGNDVAGTLVRAAK